MNSDSQGLPSTEDLKNMAYSKFRLFLLLRTGALVLIAISLTISFHIVQLHYTTLILALLLIIQMAEILRYVTRTHQELDRALQSILVDDFTTRFSKSRTTQHPLLSWSNVIQSKLTNLKQQHEQRKELLVNLIDLMPSGIICVDDHENIVLSNRLAREISNAAYIPNLEQLKRTNPGLFEVLHQLTDGREKKITIRNGQQELEYLIECKKIIVLETSYRIYTLLNMNADHDQRETESFKNLMRVLHHEIVNSITPIISLSDSMHNALTQSNSNMSQDDVVDAAAAILKRSKGLLKFSSGYRTLTDIPVPTPTLIQPAELVERMIKYFGDNRKNQINIICETRSLIHADESQLEQVMINLIKNAIEATQDKKNPQIQILVSERAHELIISITDHGIGMNDDVMANIFVPYFTTKKEGQGIGMSLCRQFVIANKGKLIIQSQPEKGTTVQLTFPVAEISSRINH